VFGDVSLRPILVADDDDFVRRFLRDVLTRQGYPVELDPNGAESL
jgi:CheY-like chemotaxis protein